MTLRLRARRVVWRRARRRWLRRAVRICLRLLLIAAIGPAIWVAAYRFIDPPVTYLIATEWIRTGEVERSWRDLDDISPDLPRAVMGGEDARFCAHYGFDFDEIAKALSDTERRRGASTLTQQVAKNVFLWPEPSWVRKGLEAGFTVLIELFWPKRRIMEVYLNVAETDEGAFGAEAAARRYFDRSAAKLTLRQSALIAAALPNPKARNPARPTAYLARRAGMIADGADTLRASGRADCLKR